MPLRNSSRVAFSLRALLIAVAVVGVALAIVGRTPRRFYNEIEIGMTANEVEALVGRPGQEIGPLDYDDLEFDEDRARILKAGFCQPRCWLFGPYMISVLLDGDQRVVCKYYKRNPAAGALRRLLDRIRP